MVRNKKIKPKEQNTTIEIYWGAWLKRAPLSLTHLVFLTTQNTKCIDSMLETQRELTRFLNLLLHEAYTNLLNPYRQNVSLWVVHADSFLAFKAVWVTQMELTILVPNRLLLLSFASVSIEKALTALALEWGRFRTWFHNGVKFEKNFCLLFVQKNSNGRPHIVKRQFRPLLLQLKTEFQQRLFKMTFPFHTYNANRTRKIATQDKTLHQKEDDLGFHCL